MRPVGIIGGSAMPGFPGLSAPREEERETPYGKPSAPLVFGEFAGRGVVFLQRHGRGRRIAPHRINYRANLHALSQAGVSAIIAVAAVGGITARMRPQRLVIPHQIVDYTWGRAQTFFEGETLPTEHVDFTHPYDAKLREILIRAAAEARLDCAEDAVYGATQGPRLETAAEIDRLERDGCDIVGMTGMPEAALARELGLPYACCAVVANWAAGRSAEALTMASIEHHLATGISKVYALLARALPLLPA